MPNLLILRVVVVLLVGGISAGFHRILRRNRLEIQQMRQEIMAKLDNLTAEVAATRGAEASAAVLLGQLKNRLDAALAAQGEDDGAALQALSDDLGTSREALASAVAANSLPPDGATSSAHPDNAPPVATAPVDPQPADPVDEPTA